MKKASWGGAGGANVGTRRGNVSKTGSGRMRFVAAEDFGVKSGIVGEPTHVCGVVQRFVGRETE